MAKAPKQLIEEDVAPNGRPLRSRLDENGHELPDPVPMAPPIGYNKQPTMMENIRNMIRSEALRTAAMKAGAETFDEADDLDMAEADDYEPSSPYEQQFDPTPLPELRRRASEAAAPAAAAAPPQVSSPAAAPPAPEPSPTPAPPKQP